MDQDDGSGASGSKATLQEIRKQLQSSASDDVLDLKLDENGRELLFTGQLKISPTDTSGITVLLFDHLILFTRINWNLKNKAIEPCRRPIPLNLLTLRKPEGQATQKSRLKQSFLNRYTKDSSVHVARKTTWPINFRHLGKYGYELTLHASSQVEQEKWIELIGIAQQHLQSRPGIFNPVIIFSNILSGPGKINCAVPLDHGQKVLYGTDNGVYLSSLGENWSAPEQVLDAQHITQIDVLEERQLLLVRSNKILQSYSLAKLDSHKVTILQNPEILQTRCSFFKSGICMGRHMVSCVKSGLLSTTIKVFGTNHAVAQDESINGGYNDLELFKEFYIPRKIFSVHFLKSKICVASSQGFEVISLETLETQKLLDNTDISLEFAHKKSPRPIHLHQIDEDFLLNYSEFSFFVNSNGMRARPHLRLDWEGYPQNFAVSYPWVFAFEPEFIELRNIETGASHIVPHKNSRMLYCSSHEDVVEFISLQHR
ncbi:CNH domain-containing protein [Trichoderma chlorosporum]